MSLSPPSLGIDALRRLLVVTAGVTGDAFFRVLVETLGELLDMRHVFLGELDGTFVRPLAAWRNRSETGPAGLFEMKAYELAGTFCENLVTSALPLRTFGLEGRYPDHADLAGLAVVGTAVRRADGEVLGVLCAIGYESTVTATDLEIFGVVAERAGAEVERARAEMAFRLRTEARLRHQSALVELAHLRSCSLESALRSILPTSARTLGVARTSYWSMVDLDEVLECEQLHVLESEAVSRGARLEARTFPAYFAALRTCKAIDASDAPNDPRTAEFRVGYFDVFGIGAMLDVPVWRDGCLAGVLCFEHVGGARRWPPEEQDFATAVASAISIVLEASARTRAEERYRLVSQATGEAVWEWDLRTDFISWNDALRTVFGHDVDLEMAGGDWWNDRIHPEDRTRVLAGLDVLFAGRESGWKGGYRFQRGDGTFAHVLDRGFVTRDETGRALRMTGSMQDVTATKQLEERLFLADRMASMGTLAAGVAHEINNPLSYVKGNIEYVLEKLAPDKHLDPDLILALEDAREGAIRVRDIVRDLKVFSRADAEPKGPVDVEAVVASSVAMAWNEIRHRAKLVRRAGNPPPVLATEARLGQVVLNLVINAAQAIRDGSADSNEIRVETGVASDGRVFIEVADTGGGMTEEVRRRMFDPFFTTKAIGEGTGLGLAICHSIVTDLGGEITVESEPGSGARFRVLLAPATSAVATVKAPEGPADPLARARARVLVVDDDPSVAMTIKRILGREHDVVLASGGGDAVARLLADPQIAVLICDVMMPDVSGIDVFTEITRQAPELARKIVFMTGGAFTPLARTFMSETKQPCIEKPFAPDELRRAVAAML